jgi:type II secretory pathway pseudopilin PulG
MTNRNPRDLLDVRHFRIPSSFIIRLPCRRSTKAGYLSFSVKHAFTIVELLLVITVIIILTGLILASAGYVQKKGARARAESEIAAMSAALESYKADNGIYPRQENGATDLLNARNETNPSNYAAASLYLFTQLNGTDPNFRQMPEARNYFVFRPQMLATMRDSNGNLTTVAYVRDPFRNSYGYSTAYQYDETTGYNPTFDLWSTVNANPPGDQNQWIKNW